MKLVLDKVDMDADDYVKDWVMRDIKKGIGSSKDTTSMTNE